MRVQRMIHQLPHPGVFAIMTIVILQCGCRYDGSFMQMNSDSPVPFLGLQLSVRNERPVEEDSRQLVGPRDFKQSAPRAPTPPTVASYPQSVLQQESEVALQEGNDQATQRFRSGGLVPTSVSSEYRSRVKYSFDSASTPADVTADEVTIRVNSF